MTVKDLADKLDVRVKDVLKSLLDRRLMMTINSTIDIDTAREVSRQFGADVQTRSFEEELIEVESEAIDSKDMVARAPVVTVMGHVDHGKTTLLDSIRTTRVAEREAGGITQHIGAYLVQVGDRSDKHIVFLDTPGHEAFTLMRARGSRVTDVVVLVVAADDGVMPQTKEAIDHARAANVPMIVAVNKIDKPGANPENVKRQLADLNLVPEDWGGSTVFVEVSAKKKTGLDLLLEMILLVTDIGEHKANPKRAALGTVLETKLDRGRGPVATVLVQDGSLRVGDNIIAGPVVGRVRAIIDDRGRRSKWRARRRRSRCSASRRCRHRAIRSSRSPIRRRRVRSRLSGSRRPRSGRSAPRAAASRWNRCRRSWPRATSRSCRSSSRPTCRARPKCSPRRSASWPTTRRRSRSFTRRSAPSTSPTCCWRRRPTPSSSASTSGRIATPADVAEREKVDIRHHSVIYNVTDEIKKAMAGLLDPTFKEQRLGSAVVRETFKVPKIGTIAGCMVQDGRITRSGDAQARLLRDNVVVWEGKLASLRRFKDDVSEVKAGFECGIGLQNFNDLKIGDVIEVFTMERVATAV